MEWKSIFANDVSDESSIFLKYIKNHTFSHEKRQKLGRVPEYILFQRCTDNQQAHETKLTIVNHQRNVYQNHNEILPHTCQNVLSKRQVTGVLRR